MPLLSSTQASEYVSDVLERRCSRQVLENWAKRGKLPLSTVKAEKGPLRFHSETIIRECIQCNPAFREFPIDCEIPPYKPRPAKKPGPRAKPSFLQPLEAPPAVQRPRLAYDPTARNPYSDPAPPPQRSASPAPMAARAAPRSGTMDLESILPATTDDLPEGVMFEDGQFNINQARAWKELEAARRLQIQRLADEEKYMHVEKVRPEWEKACQTINRSVMGIASRLKADRPETPLDTIEFVRRLCRDALEKASVAMEDGAY